MKKSILAILTAAAVMSSSAFAAETVTPAATTATGTAAGSAAATGTAVGGVTATTMAFGSGITAITIAAIDAAGDDGLAVTTVTVEAN